MYYFEQNWPVALIIIFFGIKYLKGLRAKKEVKKLIQGPCQIIDVRSVKEFESGHAPNSLNIPLDTFQDNSSTVRKDIPVIIVCKTGTRSAMAKMVLKRNGYTNVTNGGPWSNALN